MPSKTGVTGDPSVLRVGDEQVSRFVYVIGVAERVLPILATKLATRDAPRDAARQAVVYAEALWTELQDHFQTCAEVESKKD